MWGLNIQSSAQYIWGFTISLFSRERERDVKENIKFAHTTLDVHNTTYVIAFKGICAAYLNLEFQ